MGIGTKVQINFEAQLLGHPGAIYCMQPAYKGFYSCGADGWLVHWDLSTSNDGVRIATAGQAVYSMLVHEDTCYLGTYSQQIIGLRNGELFTKVNAHNKGVFFVKEANGYLLSGGGDGFLCIWNLELQLVKRIKLSNNALRCALWFNNKWHIAGADGAVFIVNADLDLQHTISVSAQSIFAITALGNDLFVGGRDAKIVKIDADFNLQFWDAHLLHIHALLPIVEHNLLLSTSMDKTCRLWTSEGQLLKVLDANKYGAHLSSVNDALSLPNNTLVTCSDDKSIMVYTLSDNN